MKKAILLFTCMIMLTGCWDKTELKELGIVMGIAVDKNSDTGDYILTSQMLRPSALNTQSSSSEPPFEKVVTTGKTIYEAIRKANLEFDRKGFYAHNKVVLVSEDIAKEGLIPVLDSFKRGKEIRGFVYLCITKDAEAGEILESSTTGVEPLPSIHLKNMIENTDYQFTAAKINLLNFYKESLVNGIDPVVGVLKFEEDDLSKKHVKLSGGAVFSKGKLVGFLNEKETRGYLLGKGEVENGALSLPSTIDEDRYESVEVKKASAKIQPTIKGDEISFTINVSGEGIIVEQQSTATLEDVSEQLKQMKKLEGEMEQLIKGEINIAVEKAQKEFQADVFGFGRTLNKEDPKIWNNVKKDWKERFPDVPYTVNVNFNIKATGLMKGPFQPAD